MTSSSEKYLTILDLNLEMIIYFFFGWPFYQQFIVAKPGMLFR